jgi:DNA polymerase III subunit delta'
LAEELIDPREVPWHPRFAPEVLGHDASAGLFKAAFASGKPHHAWLITGAKGIGKASFAYAMARHVLGHSMRPEQVTRWVHARAHPDLTILERGFNDAKPKKLKGEIGVDEARSFIDFFSRTSGSGGWRVGIVDCADDLNTESANALLKLVEEPPNKVLILLVCHAPGKLLRTLRSRCRTLVLAPLEIALTAQILNALPLESAPGEQALSDVARLSGGAPGQALALLNSAGAKAFQLFQQARKLDAATRVGIGQHFSGKAAGQADFDVFMQLFMAWLAQEASTRQSGSLAALHGRLGGQATIVNAYNLDRRVAVMDAINQLQDALKAA